jgi:hypothetical protein
MSRAEIEAKFRGNASLVMSDDQAARVIRKVDALAEDSGVRGLMESLTY